MWSVYKWNKFCWVDHLGRWVKRSRKVTCIRKNLYKSHLPPSIPPSSPVVASGYTTTWQKVILYIYSCSFYLFVSIKFSCFFTYKLVFNFHVFYTCPHPGRTEHAQRVGLEPAYGGKRRTVSSLNTFVYLRMTLSSMIACPRKREKQPGLVSEEGF